jgi:ubiquinone/menaquinone biosynthesis C-methylase UbiE
MTIRHVPAEYGKMDLKKALEFDRKVKENFFRAYPAVAGQIIKACAVVEGICIDVGAGTALLSIELARKTSLNICALEKAPAMLEVGNLNIEAAGLGDKIRMVLGDAHSMPFSEAFADLVVSRGSFHYWEDKGQVFREIYRVLKKGGWAFVGGGFGPGHTAAELETMIKLRNESLGDASFAYRFAAQMEGALAASGIDDYHVIDDMTGLWAIIKKFE